MTRKDYVAIARAFAATRPPRTRVNLEDDFQWDEDRRAIVRVLAADNSRFDEERFLAACEAQ